MTPDEAYRFLDLPRDATAEQIKQRYLDLAPQAHPDGVPGAGGMMAALTEARKLALDAVEARMLQVAPTVQAVVEAGVAQESRERALRQLRRAAARPQRYAQRFLALLGAGSLAALALFQERLSDFLDWLPETARGPAAAVLGIGGIILLVGAALLGLRMLFTRQALEDTSEYLAEPDSFYDTLRRLYIRVDKPLSSEGLRVHLGIWLKGRSRRERLLAALPVPVSDMDERFGVVARRAGGSAVARLILASGLEHGILRVREHVDAHGLPELRYELAPRITPVRDAAEEDPS